MAAEAVLEADSDLAVVEAVVVSEAIETSREALGEDKTRASRLVAEENLVEVAVADSEEAEAAEEEETRNLFPRRISTNRW